MRARRFSIVLGLVVLVASAAFALAQSTRFEMEIAALRATAWGALGVLCLTLVTSPVGELLSRRQRLTKADITRWRRQLGLLTWFLGSLHAGFALAIRLRGEVEALLSSPFFRAGLTALLILTFLGVTSFPKVVKAFRLGAWKALHRLVYVAGLVAFQHALLAPAASRRWLLLLAGVTLAISVLRLRRLRRAQLS